MDAATLLCLTNTTPELNHEMNRVLTGAEFMSRAAFRRGRTRDGGSWYGNSGGFYRTKKKNQNIQLLLKY